MKFCFLIIFLMFVAVPQGVAQSSLLGQDPVFQNAAYGNADAVEKFLLTGNNPNIRDLKKVPLLHHAAIASVPKTVQTLLKHGAQVDLADPFGNTALMQAAAYGSTKAALLLIESGAKVNEENQQGETALIKAAKTGNLEIVEILLEKGASPNLTDFTGRTALDHARQNRHSRVVERLDSHKS